MYRYDREKKQFHLFPTPTNNEKVIFQDFLEDKAGNYWLATWHGGVYQYKTKEKSFTEYTSKDKVLWYNSTAMINDPLANAVWIGSFNYGVSRFDLLTGKRQRYFPSDTSPEYTQLSLVRDMKTDAAGKIWMATYGAGIYYYDHNKPKEKAFTHITTRDGLTNSSYYAIASDNKSRVWLLSSKGLSAINDTGKFLYEVPVHPAISFSNYAPDLRFPKRMAYSETNNELLVPVAGGLLVYHPDKPVPPVNFPIVLTDIAVDGRPVTYDSMYSGINKPAIPYNNNSLSFQFAALNYNPGRNIHYEYKLHQNDNAWKSIGASGAMNFPDLSPGRYTLIVRGKDAAGNISSNTILYAFRITPP